ncbi:unnamed protein product [Clonostachys byssicola]|uniref:Uncharacterized protein n=1 Tax=Clonostachys byssicola TaxID=160290 RepID=A0A9N9Y209_9HYPO|nr:unnamed protein product [Clonostachys byssicola]
MEVLGGAATLAKIAAKGLETIQGIANTESDYAELCGELNFIEAIIRNAQQTSMQGKDTTPMFGIQDQIEKLASMLTEISKGLNEIKAKCQHKSTKGGSSASKTKWFMHSGKIGEMRQKAKQIKEDLHMAINMHMSTLNHQRIMQLQEVVCRLDISARQLEHMPHAAMVILSAQEQIMNGQTEEDAQRIQELDDEGNELNSNDTSATTHAQGPAPLDAPSQSLVGQRTTVAVAFQKTKCPTQCVCRCHTRSRKISSPEWIKKLTGSWELQYKPQIAGLQWDTRCPCNKSDGLEIAWRPPEWWWIQSFFPRPNRYSLKCALRPARVLPWGSQKYGYLDKSVADICQAMDNGMAVFPDDEFDIDFGIIELFIAQEQFEVLEFLLLQWKNILVESGLSRSAGFWASSYLRFKSLGEPEVRVLEQVVSYVDWETDLATSPLHEVALLGSGVQESCAKQKDLVDTWDETGHTPLHHAITQGHTQAVQDLIDAGVNVNRRTFNEDTPLTLAAVHGRTECMRRLLLTRRINRIDERDRFKRTALHCAASGGHSEAVRLLLEAGASPLLRSIWGDFPLHHAVKSENENPAEIAAIINLLLDAPGTDINATNDRGDTAIMMAVRNNNHVALRCLAQAGASLTAVNKDSDTMLHLAAWCGDLETLHFLDGQELTCINWKLPGELSWTPWMWFMRRLNHSERKPDPAEMIAFVQLYRGIRDRDLAHDISLLEQTLAALDRNDEAEAPFHLSAIIQSKEAYYDEHSAGFYRGLRGHLSCGDKERLLDDIQADLQELRLEMASSPWDLDPFGKFDSDECLSESDESLSNPDESISDSEDFSESPIRQESDASNGN